MNIRQIALSLVTALGAGSGLAASQVAVDVSLANTFLKADRKSNTFLRVALTGFEIESTKAQRPPVNVAIVLDKSGSMEGSKMTNARQAAKEAIQHLGPRDIVSVVLYDSNVRVLVPATKVSDKAAICERIDQIRANGSTALFAGVSKGAAEVRKFLNRDLVNRIILLSDGIANVGPSSPSALGELGAALKKDGIAVSTIGLGDGCNEDLMFKLADRSDGRRGTFLHPPELKELRTTAEQEFFERISPVWQPGEALFLESGGESDGPAGAASGWFSWFWGDGVRHVFWKRQPSGRVIGVEADRAALLAAVIANLPEPANGLTGLRVLADARGQVIYQWGDPDQVGSGLEPSSEIDLGDPLKMWRLRSFATSTGAGVAGTLGNRATSGLIAAIGLAALFVLLLAAYFYREHNRQMREAEERVSFVNQVSHELKTPLTNIRMYAELAGERVEAMEESDTGDARKFLKIVTDETSRLSRLIGNVLAFARENRGEEAVQPRAGSVDTVIASSLKLFRPALEKRDIKVELDREAADTVLVVLRDSPFIERPLTLKGLRVGLRSCDARG